jgi:peptidoglycan/xylan/chitin deacetylase (PgdA/CDA1 family)
MLLKRFIVLMAGVLLFIAAYIIYFDVSHMQMEARFQQERKNFGVEGANLTAAGPVTPTTAPAPVATPLPDSTPASSAAPDSNSNPAPANPATPDPNTAPATPSSTMNDSPGSRSPFIQLASYRPSDGVEMQIVTAGTGQTATSPATTNATPSANAVPASAPTVTTQLVTTPAIPTTTTVATAKPAPEIKSAAAEEGSVIVLLYHQFKPAGVVIPTKFQWTMNQDVFASEMKYIHDNGYNVISMDQLIKFIKHEGTVPPRAVCITVDDGYKSAIVYAAPILKQYGYPWTFFIYPEFITVAEGSGAASWNDLLELQKEGIDIECHSMTHPILKSHRQKIKGVWQNFTPDQYAAWLTNETAGAKAILEQHMGKKITRCAYPYGEYNTQVENAVIAAGFEAIFTVADNPVHSTTSLHSIGRYTITQGVEKNFAAYLRQGALGLADANPAPGATITNPRPVITATLGYPGKLDPNSIETSVRDFGVVRHDFDPQTNTIRLYLPRDLIQSVALVNIRVKDAETGQVMVANWHFNYEPDPATDAAVHPPIPTITNSPSASTKAPAIPSPSPAPVVPASTITNTPAATEPEPLEKSAVGTPIDTTPAPKGTD